MTFIISAFFDISLKRSTCGARIMLNFQMDSGAPAGEEASPPPKPTKIVVENGVIFQSCKK